MSEPTLLEWIEIFLVRKDAAKKAIYGDHDEYADRYLQVMTDADHQIRSWCNRLSTMARDKRKSKEAQDNE